MKAAIVLLVAVVLAGCGHRVVIDRRGVDMNAYQRDLAECRTYADEVSGGARAATGALGGAVVGGAVGAILGDSRSAEKLAGVGAVTGAARGGGSAARERSTIVKNCLRGRGYQVLN